MQIDSSSLKEDVTAMLKCELWLPDELSVDDKANIMTFIGAAIEFGVAVIDHDKIATEEDLKRCTRNVSERVERATLLLMGGIKILAYERFQPHSSRDKQKNEG